jgi:hypothetical protein
MDGDGRLALGEGSTPCGGGGTQFVHDSLHGALLQATTTGETAGSTNGEGGENGPGFHVALKFAGQPRSA